MGAAAPSLPQACPLQPLPQHPPGPCVWCRWRASWRRWRRLAPAHWQGAPPPAARRGRCCQGEGRGRRALPRRVPQARRRCPRRRRWRRRRLSHPPQAPPPAAAAVGGRWEQSGGCRGEGLAASAGKLAAGQSGCMRAHLSAQHLCQLGIHIILVHHLRQGWEASLAGWAGCCARMPRVKHRFKRGTCRQQQRSPAASPPPPRRPRPPAGQAGMRRLGQAWRAAGGTGQGSRATQQRVQSSTRLGSTRLQNLQLRQLLVHVLGHGVLLHGASEWGGSGSAGRGGRQPGVPAATETRTCAAALTTSAAGTPVRMPDRLQGMGEAVNCGEEADRSDALK